MHSSTGTSHLDDLMSFIDQMTDLVNTAHALFERVEAHSFDFDLAPDDLASASFMVIALTTRLRRMQEADRG